jgi:hypothetical protein
LRDLKKWFRHSCRRALSRGTCPTPKHIRPDISQKKRCAA